MSEYNSDLVKKTFFWIKKNPNKKKLYDADLNLWLTNGQLLDAVDQAVKTFNKVGLKVGDLLLLALPNSTAYVISYLAAMRTGLAIYSMNPKMPEKQTKNEFRKRNYKAAILDDDYQELFNQIVKNPKIKTLSNYGDYLIKLTSWETIKANNDVDDFDEIPKHSGIVIYTSGTTGKPKGVLLDHSQMYTAGDNVVQSHKLTENDRVYIVLPFYHINAQNIALMSALISGGSIVVQKHFSAHKFWPVVENQEVTWVSAAPAIILILLNTEINPNNLQKLRFIRSTSAPLAIAAMDQFEERFKVPILNSYGMTEAPSQIAVDPMPPLHSPVGSSGKPFNIAIKISDKKLTKELPIGENGEIWIKGTNTITSYLHNRDQESFVNGWFRTGDVGHLDKDGFIFLAGRSKEMINKSGDKISPYEVEDIIDKLPFVDSAAVIGYPDKIYGETVAAVIILKDSTDKKTALIDFAKQIRKIVSLQEEKFKVPQYIFFMKDIPRGATGKIQRTALKNKIIENKEIDKY
ncbi:AMP-binding protein [Oenococcus oeni]|uniref:AMP-binding protein n=1 Tax=Oenococcus oeni TaxID=1247 RepID=UPI0010B4F809|nr:AMP-binding protein [Oenococcus oeni]SYW14738.1 putative o-succinylbenzoate--CoA ligase (menE) [Oenococcus oeni]